MSGSGGGRGVSGSDGRGVRRGRRQRTINGNGVLLETGVQVLHMLFGEMRSSVSAQEWFGRRINRLMYGE